MRGLALFVFVLLSACGGSGSPPPPQLAPAAPTVNIEVGLKQLIFSWDAVPGATSYRLLENPDGHSGFTQVGADIPVGTLSVSLPIAVHLQDFTNALYVVQACNVTGCNGSTEVHAMNRMLDAIGYFKASNTGVVDLFGDAIALSADGNTLVVGAWSEDSGTTGINGDQSDDSAREAGAVYLFRFDGTAWSQQAYIKASNTELNDKFGHAVALSADGNTLAVGAIGEDSNATGINGDQNDNSAQGSEGSGAVYIFRFDGTVWSQQAYVKASNTGEADWFGFAVTLSADGNTLAVGAYKEDSRATGINGDQSDNSASSSGAAYLFRFDGIAWSQQAYVKASNAEIADQFGLAIALNSNGNTLAVGAAGEDSSATGINGDQSDNSAFHSGAVYVFQFDGIDWSEQAYVKASNAELNDRFGGDVSLSADGNTLAVGARREDSNAADIDGDQSNNLAEDSGVVYVFQFRGTTWSQQAYIKASNTESMDDFGHAVALSADGNTLAVGAPIEGSSATGINGDQSDNSASSSGVMYLFRFDGTAWLQKSYVKASNTESMDEFGHAVALSADGNTLAVGAHLEGSSATGINGDQSDNSAFISGAVYLY